MPMFCDGFRRARPVCIVLAAALVVAGCGGDSGPSVEATDPSEPPDPPATDRFDRAVDQAVAQLAPQVPLVHLETHTRFGDRTFDHRQLHRARRFDVLFSINSTDRYLNPRSYVSIAPGGTPWDRDTGPWYWPSRLVDFLDDIEPQDTEARDAFDQQIVELRDHAGPLGDLIDHPPGPLPWRDDFVAWRERTRPG